MTQTIGSGGEQLQPAEQPVDRLRRRAAEDPVDRYHEDEAKNQTDYGRDDDED
jgi:hypothetical protein